MTDAPTPGWYHAEGDPPNTHRYWDGTSWQGDPRPTTPTPETPTPATPAAAYAGAAQPMAQRTYPEASQSTVALVMSILGLAVCAIGGPIGWYLGQQELNGIDAGLRDPTNRGTANAAKVIGIVATVMMVVSIVGFALFVFWMGGLFSY